jgi:hypothetical protein
MDNRKKIIGMINVYSRRTRDQLMALFTNFINRAGIDRSAGEIYSCVDELIKNAVKANYKFVLILDKMYQIIKEQDPSLSDKEVKSQIDEIVRHKEKYDKMADKIVKENDVSKTVRKILNEESKLLKIKNKKYQENREYSEEEIEEINSFENVNMIRRELEARDIKIIMKIELENDFLFIEVTNTAPIMGEDMRRIHSKRDEFKTYLGTGREYEFFMNNLDTSESGFGLGYATIDSFLYDLGLDPYQTIQLLAASDTTIILSLPVGPLTKENLAS